MQLSDIAIFVDQSIRSTDISLSDYVTTDSLLQNREGRVMATNLPPNPCNLTLYQPGDILMANIRPYLKKIWMADTTGGCSADVLVFRAKDEISSNYLYSVLLQDSFFDYVMLAPKGSKMPRGDKNHIMRFPIVKLSDDDANKVGDFIWEIEAKLSNNRKQNAILEKMAKQIYDYWFVQFDFPDENGRPYKSSGGKMVWNETLKREIPEGWENSQLIDIANITMGQSPDGASYNGEGIGAVFYQGSTDFGVRFPKVRQYTTQPSRFAKAGDILMSVRAPVGATNFASQDCCIGRGLSAINSKIGSITYVYEVISYFKTKFEQMNAAGTTFGSITKNELFSLPCVKPKQDVVDAFEKICSPIFDKQMSIGYETEALQSLRSYLLPLLMTGQAKIK